MRHLRTRFSRTIPPCLANGLAGRFILRHRATMRPAKITASRSSLVRTFTKSTSLNDRRGAKDRLPTKGGRRSVAGAPPATSPRWGPADFAVARQVDVPFVRAPRATRSRHGLGVCLSDVLLARTSSAGRRHGSYRRCLRGASGQGARAPPGGARGDGPFAHAHGRGPR